MIRQLSDFDLEPTYREALARTIERHTGAGLSAAEIRKINKAQKLSIPVADYVPETLEEIVVSYADKLVIDDHQRSFEEGLEEKKLKFGEKSEFQRSDLRLLLFYSIAVTDNLRSKTTATSFFLAS